jgi:cytochrome c-type biogenesis protein CcmH/NrfG
MGRHPQSGGQVALVEFRGELLDRLGLGPSASDGDIERAHGELTEFLDSAPHGVRAWATARVTDADEAFALLSGPADLLTAAAPKPVVTSQQNRQQAPAQATPEVTRAAVLAAFRPRSSRTWWVVLPVVLAAVVLGVYRWGGGSSIPGAPEAAAAQPTATAAATSDDATQPLDKAKVADLMKKIAANPKDTKSLLALGDAYFASADYKTAALWERKVLAIDPKNQSAMLALGAALFNSGDAPAAEKEWLATAKLYPDNAEVHYDLGFLYLSQTPPNTAKVKVEWQKVIDIDPTTNVAKTVATHLKTFEDPAGTASPAPSAKQ